MSAEATGWVYRHSPFTGLTFAVHLAIADSVNDQNENEFWMRLDRLAEKVRATRPRVSEAVAKLEAEGLLLQLDRPAKGAPVRYRFETPGDWPTVYEPRASRSRREQLAVPRKNSPGVPSENSLREDLSQAGTQGLEVLPAPGAPSQREMFGAVADACGWDQANPLTKNAQAHLASVAKQLREAGATLADIPHFAADYRAHWPGMDLTPGAMVKWWSAWAGGQFTPAQPRQPYLGVIDTLISEARKEQNGSDGRTLGGGQDGPPGGVLSELPEFGGDGRGVE